MQLHVPLHPGGHQRQPRAAFPAESRQAAILNATTHECDWLPRYTCQQRRHRHVVHPMAVAAAFAVIVAGAVNHRRCSDREATILDTDTIYDTHTPQT
jgi:hypothetical protein